MSLDSFLASLKEFGGLISTGFLLVAGGVLYKVMRSTIKQREAHIELLRERLKAGEGSSLTRFADDIDAVERILKVFREWLRNSESSAQDIASMASEKDGVHKARIERELAARARIVHEHEAHPELRSLEIMPQSIEAFFGIYSVIGKVSEGTFNSYEGILEVKSKGEGVVSARWVIGPTGTEYSGHGVFEGGRLAIAYKFRYEGCWESGVALYELVGRVVLRGVWAQPSSTYLGIEECRRLEPDELTDLNLASLHRRSKPPWKRLWDQE